MRNQVRLYRERALNYPVPLLGDVQVCEIQRKHDKALFMLSMCTETNGTAKQTVVQYP